MKKLILIAAVAALAGCNKKAEEAAPAATEAAAPTAAATSFSTTKPGTYNVVDAKGAASTTVINADGTYVDKGADGKEVKGAFAVKDGKDCFVPEGKAEECFTVSAPAADGSFKATSPDGKSTVTVTPAKK